MPSVDNFRWLNCSCYKSKSMSLSSSGKYKQISVAKNQLFYHQDRAKHYISLLCHLMNDSIQFSFSVRRKKREDNLSLDTIHTYKFWSNFRCINWPKPHRSLFAHAKHKIMNEKYIHLRDDNNNYLIKCKRATAHAHIYGFNKTT